MDRIINIHIPKTGGSTMYQVMRKNVDHKRTLWAGSKHATVIPWFTALSQEERNWYTGVFGHIRYGFHRFFTDGTPRYFTFMRHPIERTLSAYSYALEYPRDEHHFRIINMTFTEYASDLSLGQRQTNWLMGYLATPDNLPTLESYGGKHPLPPDTVEIVKNRLINEFAFVGILEQYDESILLLQDAFKWRDVYYMRSNVTKKRLRYSDLNAEEKRTLDALTGPDFEIYDWVRARLQAQIEAQGDGFQQRLKDYKAYNVVYAARLKRYKDLKRKLSPKRLVKRMLGRQ